VKLRGGEAIQPIKQVPANVAVGGVSSIADRLKGHSGKVAKHNHLESKRLAASDSL
jgi:hypothetical protein